MNALSAQFDYDKLSDKTKLRIQQEFDYFCKRVLKNEFLNACKEDARQQKHESPLNEFGGQEHGQLYTTDRYFEYEHIFMVSGLEIVINSELLAEILMALPERKRNIILLSQILGFSDSEAGKLLGIPRSTVQYQRKNTLDYLTDEYSESGIYDEWCF